MTIIYSNTHSFNQNDLEELFLSVNWESGKYPTKLAVAVKNYETVISAWDGDKLVGLICAMDDGIMTAYIHYLLVNPEYQRQGIGKALLEKTKEIYKDYLRVLLLAYNNAVDFYRACGFTENKESVPMFISNL